MAVLNSVFLQQADWDALAEHALTPYLPFLGGVALKGRFNYSGPKTKKVLFYAVKYEPELFFDAGDHRLKTAEDLLRLQAELPGDEIEYSDDNILLDVVSKVDEEHDLAKSRCCEEWISKGFEIDGVLEVLESSSIGHKAFFKTGLTASSAKARGGKAYKQVLFEKEITDPHYSFKSPRATRAAVIEKCIQLKLFYKYWKDHVWLHSPGRILYEAIKGDFIHMRLTAAPSGLYESLMWDDVDQKLSFASELFDHLNGLSNRDLGAAFREVDSFNHAWRWVAQIKQRQYVFIRDLLMWSDFDKEHVDKVRQSRSWGLSSPRTKELNFLREKGFQAKWLPVNADDLNRIYELSAEQFNLPGISSWSDDYTIPYP